ncbi:Solute carrier family 22 member 2 [Holothuria leucospilota]|uniref:Solute carrier family 22 member 2 n=1 Tax=Holothuria leucospilota TaxID=206669 RepID=A0A9Q1BNN0_HOLLE|nr:Solute carrier family 22 member 2 [Holothuria leucospilota]
MQSLNADDILIELNPFGRLQVVFLITSAYVQFFLPMHGQSINFLGAKPDFHCSAREGYLLNESVPLVENDDGVLVFSQCQEYIDPGNSNATQDCQNGWTYSQEYYGETIITEWDLVCNNYPAAAETSQSIQQVGGMMGAIAFGILADQYGRRPSFLLSVVIFDIAGVGICFSPNYVVFVIFKFFCGFGQMAIWTTFSSNLSEYMIPKYRNRAMTVPAITFSFGLMFMALLAFLISDWRYLQLAIVSPYIVGMLGFWFLPESLRWRLSKENTKQAEILVNKIAKINRKEVTKEMFYQWNKEDIDTKLSTISENIVTSPPSKVSTDLNNGTVPKDSTFVSENVNVNGRAENKNSEAGVAKGSTQSKYFGLFKPPVLHITIVISTLRNSGSGFSLSMGRIGAIIAPFVLYAWDLVCNQYPAAAETSQSIQQVGGMVGAILSGVLADWYGRRPSFLLSVIIFDIAGLGIALSPNYIAFVIFRFFYGFGQMAIWTTISSNLSEYMIPKYRNRAMTVPAIPLAFGLMFMALLAFLIRDWRYLQFAVVAPYIVGLLGFWFLPESLRWQLSKQKTKQAELLVIKIAKINRKEIPKEMFYKSNKNEVDDKISTISGNSITSSPSKITADSNGTVPKDINSFSENVNSYEYEENKSEGASVARSSTQSKYLELFKPPVLHITIVVSLLRLTYTLVYFGFALSTGRLAGNPYLNFFLSALVEAPARIFAPFIYKWVRRTYLIFFCYICCGAGLTAIIFIPQQTKSGTDLAILTTVLSLLGKFFVSVTLAGVLLLNVELFPTTLRNSGNGLTLFIARIGAVIAPFMLYADNVVPNFSSYLMAIISFLTAFSALTLTDTRKTVQPQNTADLKVLMNSRKKSNMGVENKAFEEDIDLKASIQSCPVNIVTTTNYG